MMEYILYERAHIFSCSIYDQKRLESFSFLIHTHVKEASLPFDSDQYTIIEGLNPIYMYMHIKLIFIDGPSRIIFFA